MNRRRLAVAALIVCALAAGITLAVASRRESGRLAAMGVDRLYEFDHGPVFVPTTGDPSLEIAHEFTVQNESREQPLRLTPKLKTCGCINAEARPNVVPPLQEARVRVAFHPALVTEQRREYVVFETNQAAVKKIAFVVTAQVLPAIDFEYDRTIRLERNEQPVAQVKVLAHATGGRENPLSLTAARKDIHLRQGSSSRDRLGGGIIQETNTYTVELTENALESLRSSGRFSVGLVARCGENTRMGRLQFVMPMVIRPNPSTLFLRSESGGQPRILELSSDVPFEVLEVRDSAHILKAQRLSEGRSQTHRLAVSWKDNVRSLHDDAGGSVRRTDLSVATENASDEGIVIPVYILASEAAQRSAAPN